MFLSAVQYLLQLLLLTSDMKILDDKSNVYFPDLIQHLIPRNGGGEVLLGWGHGCKKSFAREMCILAPCCKQSPV